MRQRFVWDKDKGDWVPHEKFHGKRRAARLQVMGDIQPYRSVVTGEVVGGRRQHREHLKAHGLVEVGNERLPERKVQTPSAAPDIAEAFNMVRGGYRPPPLDTYKED